MQYIRIRNLREDMDMTQTDMAKVPVSYTHLSYAALCAVVSPEQVGFLPPA